MVVLTATEQIENGSNASITQPFEEPLYPNFAEIVTKRARAINELGGEAVRKAHERKVEFLSRQIEQIYHRPDFEHFQIRAQAEELALHEAILYEANQADPWELEKPQAAAV